MVKAVGPRCYMAKVDIKHAFRLCVQSKIGTFSDIFGGIDFSSTCVSPLAVDLPPSYLTFADALLWIISVRYCISGVTHYLDDFFITGSDFSSCRQKVQQHSFNLRDHLRHIAENKLEGPSQVLTYLGIEIDTVNGVIQLPEEKLVNLQNLVNSWLEKRKCTKRQLQSLIGHLSFAYKVVKPGRIFLRRLIDLSTTPRLQRLETTTSHRRHKLHKRRSENVEKFPRTLERKICHTRASSNVAYPKFVHRRLILGIWGLFRW